MYYNAGVAVENFKVVGLALGYVVLDKFLSQKNCPNVAISPNPVTLLSL
jgi:hypothetical protein